MSLRLLQLSISVFINVLLVQKYIRGSDESTQGNMYVVHAKENWLRSKSLEFSSKGKLTKEALLTII